MNPLKRSLAQTARLARSSARPTCSLNLRQRREQSTTTTTQPVEWEQKEIDPQLDGYPQLPALSYQRRRPGSWDDPQDKRNFGEPVPEEYEALSVWSYDHYALSGGQAVKQLSVAVAAFLILFGATYAATPSRPSVARQYPFSGLVTELGGIEGNQANSESIAGEAEDEE